MKKSLQKALFLIIACFFLAPVFSQPALPPSGLPAGATPMGGGLGGMNLDTSKYTKKFLDIPYATLSATPKLDIYLPETGTGPFPVIIAIHGGAFRMGSKTGSDLAAMFEGLSHGYAVVAVDYRLSGEAVFPAVVDWFGPVNFLEMDAQFEASGITPAFGKTSSATSAESAYLGKLITEIPAVAVQANPESYISSDDPAFLIQHGTADRNVPTQQSINIAAKLKQALGANKVDLILLEGAAHGGSQFETKENLAIVFAFLDKYMK